MNAERFAQAWVQALNQRDVAARPIRCMEPPD